jgi:hypothetical protein
MNFRELLNDPAFRKAITVFVLIKILVIASGYIGYFLIPAELSSRKYITDNPLTNPWAQYDGKAYLDIAKNGYNAQFDGIGNYGFYPLYPMLIKGLSLIGYDLAALLISNVFSLLAVMMLYLLVRDEFGAETTRKVIFYFLAFPTAYFLSVMYSESLFIFLVLATFYYGRKGNWAAAGAAGFLASLTRLQGVILFLPMAYLYMEQKKFEIKKIRLDALFLILIPLAVAVFFYYLYIITGNPLVGEGTFAAHGKSFVMPWMTFANEFMNVLSAPALKNYAWIGFHTFLAVTFTALSIVSFKYLRRDYSIYFLLSAIVPLFSSSFEGLSRYYLAIFPMFILLPIMEKNGKMKYAIYLAYALFIVMLVVLTIRHVNMHLDPLGL